MTLKFNSIDVYFHMTNHYKKLRSVKSVVDTSSPAGYDRQSRPPSRSEYRRESCQNDRFPLKIRKDKFKNTSNFSVNKNCETPRGSTNFVRSASVPARPPTRRRLVDMPTAQVCPQRAQSSGPFIKEKSNIPNLRLSRSNRSSRFNSPADSSTPRSLNQPRSNSSQVKINNHKAVSKESEPPIPAPRKTKRRRNAFKNWIVEHDYMEFMLRITEDIIQNNLYTGEEILQVLNNHIEANMERLSVPKMMQQIRILCQELNVPFDKILISNSNFKAEFMEPLKSIEKSSICTCNSANNNKYDFGDCECATKRSSPFQCAIHNGKFEIDNLLKMNQDFSPSQNIVETYYFKNANDSADLKQTTSINNNESNDQESTNTQLTPHSLSCVPELSEASESSEVTTSRTSTNEPQASQPSHKCSTSPKAAIKHKHPCNCNKGKQFHIHTHAKFSKSLNCNESVQLPNNKTKIENSANNSPKPVTENVFYIGCQCSNPTEPSPILPGPQDAVLCCTNVHQVNPIPKSGINELFAFKKIDKTKNNQNEIVTVQDSIKVYHSPVAQKTNFYNRNENFHDQDEEFVLSLGTAFMPKSVSRTSSGSLFENICMVAPDATDKCKLILLKNIQKQFDSTVKTEENNEQFEISDLNSSYIMEASPLNTKNILCKENVSEKNFSDKCCAQISSMSTMTASKCSSRVVHDKNKNLSHKTCSKATKGTTISDKIHKNIFLIVPDDVKQDQIFVVRKSQFDKLDAQSRMSLKSEIQIIKDVHSLSTTSSMHSCMATMQDAASYQSSGVSNPAYKIKKTSYLKSIVGPQCVGESSITANRSSLKNYPPNNSFSSRNTYLSTKNSDLSNASDVHNFNSKVLSKLNDYDLTPQRDNNSNHHDTAQKRISFSTNSKSFAENFESNKDKLLLGNKYEINQVSSSTDYSQGIPDSIKQFYPNMASQTGSSDSSSTEKSMSEPSISKSYNLEPPTNVNYSIDNQEEAKSSSFIPSEYQREEQDQTDNVTVVKQATNLQLDLMLDFELSSEEKLKKKFSLPNESNVSQVSSSTSVLNELLVSYKSNQILDDPMSTSLKLMKFDKPEKSERMKIMNDDKNENLNIRNESIVPSEIKFSENLEFTDSQLLLFFKNDNTATDSIKSSINENEYQTQLNQLIEKSNENSDIGDSINIQNEFIKESLQNVEATPQSAQENLNLLDDNNVADNNSDEYAVMPKPSIIKSSLSKSRSNMNNSNFNENDQQPTSVYEKPSLKTIENKSSTISSQRRVLIKEHIVDRKESFAPRSQHQRHDSVHMELPFIQIEPSDSKLNVNNKRSNNSSNDSTQTSCCGLKSNKNKTRRDVIDVDKSLQTIPNISSIPDDQLFEVEMRRPTQAGYGAERKSLRFDYSMMSELSDVEGVKLVDLNAPRSSNAENVPIEDTKSPRSEQFSPTETNTKTNPPDTKSENSSMVIDIYKPVHSHSDESYMLDSTSLKEKNNNQNINYLED